MKGGDYTARLEAEVTRLLAVVDDKERELATIVLERPLSITLQRAVARVKELEELLSRIVYDEPSTMLATYSGGYRDIEQLTVFEHGMETAIEHIRQVARAVLDGGKT